MDTILYLLRFVHSWTRWILFAVAIVALVYFAVGWLQSRPWTKFSQTLLIIFSSLVGLQWIVGIVQLVGLGSETGFGVRHYWEHLTVQTIALIVAHLHFRWRRQTLADTVRYRNGFLLLTGVLVLMIVGVLVLPQGIQWQLRGFVPPSP